MSSSSILCWIHWWCLFFMYLIRVTQEIAEQLTLQLLTGKHVALTFPLVQQNDIWCMHYPKEWMCLLGIYNLYFWYPWDCYFDLQMKWRSRSMSSQLWLTVTSNHTELLVALNWINAFLPYLYVSLLCVLYIDWIHMRSVVSAYTCCISRIKQILIKFCIGIHGNYPEFVVWCLI